MLMMVWRWRLQHCWMRESLCVCVAGLSWSSWAGVSLNPAMSKCSRCVSGGWIARRSSSPTRLKWSITQRTTVSCREMCALRLSRVERLAIAMDTLRGRTRGVAMFAAGEGRTGMVSHVAAFRIIRRRSNKKPTKRRSTCIDGTGRLECE